MIIGIIAEYNPFHNGHIYQIDEAKKRWPDSKIIIIMSGKYVQRGELAIASFDERKKIAIKYGANEVVELPFEYATQAAHIFAKGAVELANKNNVDLLFFGSESDDSENLMHVAQTIENNIGEYNRVLKEKLKMGFSFPKSAALSLEKLAGSPIELPNDILGLEYCKQIIKNKYNIKVSTLKRTVPFKSEVVNGNFSSASLIRSKIFNKEDVSQHTPMVFNEVPDRIENYYDVFQKNVREMNSDELSKIHLISEGMENLFKKHVDQPSTEAFINAANSKRYTSSRIKRTMLYVILRIFKK